EAVLADLRRTSPDVIFHGGDLADGGSHPAEIVDRIRDLGWPGVMGNTDELHTRPESLEEFARQSSAPASLWDAVREMAGFTRSALGEDRIARLRELPRIHQLDELGIVHASPATTWKSPARDSSDAEFESAYGSLDRPVVVYGHIHQ